MHNVRGLRTGLTLNRYIAINTSLQHIGIPNKARNSNMLLGHSVHRIAKTQYNKCDCYFIAS